MLYASRVGKKLYKIITILNFNIGMLLEEKYIVLGSETV
jgi:hypothetical protein